MDSYGYKINNINDQNTTISSYNRNNFLKAGFLTFGIIISSNQIIDEAINATNSISVISRADGTYSILGTYSNIFALDYTERYKNIAKSEWFIKAYKGKTLGDIIGIDL
jgi:hypothetical protein